LRHRFQRGFLDGDPRCRRSAAVTDREICRGLFFDANVLDVGVVESNLRVWPEYDQPQDILQKAIYNGCRSNLTRQWDPWPPDEAGQGKIKSS